MKKNKKDKRIAWVTIHARDATIAKALLQTFLEQDKLVKEIETLKILVPTVSSQNEQETTRINTYQQMLHTLGFEKGESSRILDQRIDALRNKIQIELTRPAQQRPPIYLFPNDCFYSNSR